MVPESTRSTSTFQRDNLESQGRRTNSRKHDSNRRQFLGRAGLATTAAGFLANIPSVFAQSSRGSGVQPLNGSDSRVAKALALRVGAANEDADVAVPPHTTNGDEARYADKSATYTKGLLQDDIGVVNLAAYQSFKKALKSGQNIDFEAMIIGGTRTQNGPQGAYAFDMEGLDSVQFGNAPSPDDGSGPAIVPPFAQISSADYATQLVELYWGSLLRDMAFTDYPNNSTAINAAAELSGMPSYRGPRDAQGKVTPDLLFRGGFPGETIGPYISQFMITPCSYGVQPIDQLLKTLLPGIDYITDIGTFLQVQNGISTGLSLQYDTLHRYLHDGRGLSSYTHDDVLHQAYFTAFLMMGGSKMPVNPGNPYLGSRTQNGFDTFGGPDFAACTGEIAARALHRVWYQKWLVHWFIGRSPAEECYIKF